MANGTIAFDTLSTSGQISGTAVSVDADYLAYGSAKHWVIFPPSATADDSFNNSGITDNSAGDFSLARTTNLGSANYSTQINGDTTNGSDAGLTSHFADNRNLTSSVTRCVFLRSTDFAAYDADGMCATIHGDLA